MDIDNAELNSSTATTQSQGDNSTKVATTAYVDASIPTTIVGITGTMAEFDTAVTDGDIAYAGGAYHDGFSDFVANEHIDWTNASAPLLTTGTGGVTDSFTILGNATNSGRLVMSEDTDNGTNTTTHAANASIGTSHTYTWPASLPGSPSRLQTTTGGALSWVATIGANDVTATSAITDNALVRGHGGVKVVQDSGILIDDSDNILLPTVAGLRLRDTGLFINSSADGILDIVSDGDVAVTIGSSSRFEIDDDLFVVDNTNSRAGMNLGTGVNPSQLFHAMNIPIDSRAVFRFEADAVGKFAIMQMMNGNGNAMGFAVGTAFGEDLLILEDLTGIRGRFTRTDGWLFLSGGTDPARSLDAGEGIRNRGALENTGITTSTDSNYTVLDGDYIIHMVALTAGRNVTLPASASFADGTQFRIVDVSYGAGTNNITLVRNGSDTINNVGGNFVMATNGQVVELELIGANWHIIN